MKKFTLLSFLTLASVAVFAQSTTEERATVIPGSNPVIPSVQRAIWDIQLDSDPTTIAAGLAGALWTGSEFWIARWANDSIFTADAAGSPTGFFQIPGVSGTRSMTTDGNFIYIGANTSIIYKVNPVTQLVVSTITTSVPNCRYVTFDPTLNGGAGGFWTGTFASDIVAVSMTGTTLNTIPAATHGMVGIYGLAYDNFTTGGPFLWAYDQTSLATGLLTQLSMTGVPTGLTHETQSDLAGGSSAGIAGGVFITDSYVANTASICGVLQGASLFAYELKVLSGIQAQDAAEFGFSVYPNPASDVAKVNFKLTTPSSVSLNIVDVQGRIIEQQNAVVYATGSHQIVLDCKSLSKGFYFVNLTIGNKVITQKLVIK